jgi:hypothetical protein
MTNVQNYIYRPLIKESDIRILKLQPAQDFEAPLVAILQHYNLGERIEDVEQESVEAWVDNIHHQEFVRSQWTVYEAISYAWGVDASSAAIDVHDPETPATLAVKPNVDIMLRHLRYEKQERCLWIDALCINQEDAKEKERQVQFMGRIYEEADTVLVWLGPSSDGLERVDVLFKELLHSTQLQRKGHIAGLNQILETLLSRPWFWRRWIVQEVLLAKQATLLCGNHTIDLMSFTTCLWKLTQHTRLRKPYLDIVGKLCTISRFRTSFNYKGRSAILGLLFVFHEAMCSDNRDRIYALDCITPWKVPVSYLDTVEATYLRYATKHIEYENATLLNCSGAFPCTTRGLPSWVPDWRASPKFTPVTTRLWLGRTKDEFKGNVRYSGSKAILCIMGTTLATVVQVGARASYPVAENELMPLLMDWYSLSEQCITGSQSTSSSSTTTSMSVPFVQTITLGAVEPTESTQINCENAISDLLVSATEIKQEEHDKARKMVIPPNLQIALRGLSFSKHVWSRFDLTLYSTIFGGLGRSQARSLCFMGLFDDSPQDFIRVLQHTIGGRKCFFTDDGTFGFGPADMEPGDIIISVPTGYTPYVLRPVRWNWSARNLVMTAKRLLNHSYYTVVGDCYIHSFAPDGSTLQDRKSCLFEII